MQGRVWVPVLVAATLLAGCLGDDVDPPDPVDDDAHGGPRDGFEPAEPDAGLGGITGRVVTMNLEPVPDARVRLVWYDETVMQTNTTSEGRYQLNNLEPGSYRLQITAICCHEHVTTLEVEADTTTTHDVRLEPYSSDDLQEPRIENHEWRGFLECSVAFVGDELNVCGIAAIGPGLVGINATNDDFLHRWEIHPGVKTVVGGLVWNNPAPGAGEELSLFFEVSGLPNNAEDTPDARPSYARVSGDSPQEFRADAGEIINYYDEEWHEYDFENLTESLEVMFRVFAYGETLNVVYQQQFTVYWDVYYWEEAPEGATAVPDL